MLAKLAPALRFGAVGVAAALTHMAVFALARRLLQPEAANVVGFTAGFWVSFAGHRWFSFAGTSTPIGRSLRRYAVSALAGFATNQGVFVLLLRGAGWPSWAALVVAIALSAVLSFVLGRFWAFRR